MKVKLINENFKDNYVINLLRSRGIEDTQIFLNPNDSCFQSWKDLNNIDKGCEIIKIAVDNNYRIGLVVDCDIDGFSSAATIYQYLHLLNSKLDIKYYIHEHKQHGLEDKWEEMADEQFDLIICPDAASNDAKYAEELKCPILILDHHITDIAPTDNMIVINNQLSEKYKNKFQSGSGITYQFCRALDNYFNVEYAHRFIDLAATGNCGDMMSGLEVENQYLWQIGFNNISNYFLQVLCEKQSYSMGDKVNPTTVAFYIVPLINAMVRVGSMEEKQRMFEAFIDGHKMVECHKRGAKGTMEEVAIESARECTNARSHQNSMLDKMEEKIEQKIFKYDLLENQVLFVKLDDDDNFASELNGLLAMRLMQKYKRPTIVARLNSEGMIRGSLRSPDKSELTSFKSYLTETGLFEYAQGHDLAAGCSIDNSKLSKFIEVSNNDLAQYDFNTNYFEVNFDRSGNSTDLEALIKDIAKYEHIWSTGNNEPLIYVHDLHITKNDIQIMGKTKDTVKISKNNIAYMKFHAKDFIEELNEKGDIKLDIVGRANLNEWMGRVTCQIFIDEHQIKEDSIFEF